MHENAPKPLFGARRGSFDGYWGGRKARPTDDQRVWLQRCLERGWTAPGWPTRWGGAGLSADEAQVVSETMAELALPPPVVGFGLAMIGPTLLDYGTEAQRERHLAAIVEGTIRWCQGYSEPEAGSDLASLRTKAEPADDGEGGWLITGQKVWTSYADQSDWIFCLVRTADGPEVAKQAGITFLLLDLDQETITTRPIELISGASPFCEVFFDRAKARGDDVIGAVNAGWGVAKALLGYERTMIGSAMGGQMANAEAELVAWARQHLRAPTGPLPEASLRADIAQNSMSEQAFRLTIERIRQSQDAGRAPGPESSIIKLVGSELKQRHHELAIRAAGPQALGWEGPGFTDEELTHTREWLRSRANTIEGGTSEIQLGIVARRVLGLPKPSGERR
jgi:alkylation response protein AidB-like acyl-CoA dehydrogenase